MQKKIPGRAGDTVLVLSPRLLAATLLALAAEDDGGNDGEHGQADDDIGHPAGVVTFDARPHGQQFVGILAPVVLERTAVDDALVGIKHGIHANRTGFGTEEIAQVDRIAFVINLRLKYFDSTVGGNVARLVHIADGDVGTAHEVDEIAGRLDILR